MSCTVSCLCITQGLTGAALCDGHEPHVATYLNCQSLSHTHHLSGVR